MAMSTVRVHSDRLDEVSEPAMDANVFRWIGPPIVADGLECRDFEAVAGWFGTLHEVQVEDWPTEESAHSEEATGRRGIRVEIPSNDSDQGGDNGVDPAVAEWVDAHGLAQAISDCEALLQEIFGPSAQIHLALDFDPESGAEELTITGHVRVTDGEGGFRELVERDAELVRRFVSDVPAEARRYLTLMLVPRDGDPS